MKNFRILHGDNPGSGIRPLVERLWRSVLPADVELEMETIISGRVILETCKLNPPDMVYLHFANNVIFEGDERRAHTNRSAALLWLVMEIREACTSPIWVVPCSQFGMEEELRAAADWYAAPTFSATEFRAAARQLFDPELFEAKARKWDRYENLWARR